MHRAGATVAVHRVDAIRGIRATIAGLAFAAVVCVAPLGCGPARADVVTDTNFVSRVYADLLGRTAGTGEVAAGLGAIGGGAVEPWVLGLLVTTEYRSRLVAALYQSLLQRDPTPGELAGALGSLAVLTDEQLRAFLAGGLEYFNARGGGGNSGFLQAIYQDLLNRPISPTEEANLLNLLVSGTLSREDVVEEILATSEYHTGLLDDLYGELLGRPVDAPGLGAFLPGLDAGTLTNEQVIAAILASPEYYAVAQATAVPEPPPLILLLSTAAIVLAARRAALAWRAPGRENRWAARRFAG